MYRILIIISVLFLGVSSGICQNGNKIKGKKIVIETSLGNIKILLYDETPLHRDNFIKLTKSGYFDNQIFHRVIKDFMIQGGDPNSKDASKGELVGQGGPGYSIPAEIIPGFYHKKGALAAARKGDQVNPTKESSGSQFYIVQGQVFNKSQLEEFVKQQRHPAFTPQQINDYSTIGGTPHLDGSYTVFGEVIEGIEVIDKIANLPTDAYERPVQEVKYTIKTIE